MRKLLAKTKTKTFIRFRYITAYTQSGKQVNGYFQTS